MLAMARAGPVWELVTQSMSPTRVAAGPQLYESLLLPLMVCIGKRTESGARDNPNVSHGWLDR